VTIGNIIPGAGIMGVGNWYISRPASEPAIDPRAAVDAAE
jgi:formate/nitrite transporter FocA (FNT family)